MSSHIAGSQNWPHRRDILEKQRKEVQEGEEHVKIIKMVGVQASQSTANAIADSSDGSD